MNNHDILRDCYRSPKTPFMQEGAAQLVEVGGASIMDVLVYSSVFYSADKPPKEFTPQRWKEICSDYWREFVGNSFLWEGLAKGWALEDLFGLKPFGSGLLLEIRGRELSEITPTKAIFADGSTFTKKPHKDTLLIWDLFDDL